MIKKIIILVVVIVLLGGFYYLDGINYLTPEDESAYQAVFFLNGQAYFGKITSTGEWVVLEDVYYLEAQDNQAPEGDALSAPSDPAKKIQLVKLGAELHGPEDKMFIERGNVLFWENMKGDSKVMEAIKRHQGGVSL